MNDKIIICRNCGKEFKFTVGEQNFYKEKGFAEPVRCKECKNKRKESFNQNQEQSEPDIIQNDFEKMLEKFRENTVLFEEEIERRNKKRK